METEELGGMFPWPPTNYQLHSPFVERFPVRQAVGDEAFFHFFHGNPLQLVHGVAPVVARRDESRERSSSELLGALGGHVDEQEAARNRLDL